MTGLLGRSRWLTGIVNRSEAGATEATSGDAAGRSGIGGSTGVAATGASGISSNRTGTDSRSSGDGGISPAEIERARQALTVHVGPIAAVLVKKTAGKAGSVAELYRPLAEHIPDAGERSKFLQTTGWM